MCIGTDRSTGDSLGPLVGTKLEKMNLGRLHVYGTLSDPVHAVNMKDKLKDIQHLHKNPFIIAVDACLGRVKSVGSFQIGDGPLKPGAGVQKTFLKLVTSISMESSMSAGLWSILSCRIRGFILL